MSGPKTVGHLHQLFLFGRRDGIKRAAIFTVSAALDFHKNQHLTLLRNNIDFPRLRSEIGLQYPVFLFLQKLDCLFLAFSSKVEPLERHAILQLRRLALAGILCNMVLNWEDITGVGFLIWLLFTGLFYLVLYLAVLNIADDKLGNNPLKTAILLAVSAPCAFMMAMFNYNPMILFFIMVISNYFRIKNQTTLPDQKTPVNKTLSYVASFAYIVALYGLAEWFQQPVELDGLTKPYWKTLFTDVPH